MKRFVKMFSFCFFFIQGTYADVFYLNPETGDDDRPASSPGAPWKHFDAILKHVERLSPGDVVQLAPGFYDDTPDADGNSNSFPFIIPGGVSLIGDDTDSVYLDAGDRDAPVISVSGAGAVHGATISNLSVRHSSGKGDGIVLQNNIAPIVIQNCSISLNKYGVRINSSTAIVHDCDFSFNGNKGQDDPGAGIYCSDSNVEIFNSTFFLNNCSGVIGFGDLNIRNNDFSLNNSDEYGGGVYCMASGQIIDNTFTFNSARYGGGLYGSSANPQKPLYVWNNTFKENTARFSGGGVFTGGDVTVRANRFQKNKAAEGGGLAWTSGVADMTSAVKIERNSFNGNVATDTGGAIRFYDRTETVLQENVFAFNEAPKGGGVYIRDCSSSLFDNAFSYNTATVEGAGIFCGENSQAEIVGNSIENNSLEPDPLNIQSPSTGAGIHCAYAQVSIRQNAILGNWIDDNTFGSIGGGVYGVFGNYELISNIISGNIVNSSFGGAWGGGAVFRNSLAVISKNEFTSNEAKGGFPSGGGLYTTQNTAINILENRFDGNRALGQGTGGGFWVEEWNAVSAVVMAYNKITNNTGGLTGGGGYLSGDILAFNNIIAFNDLDDPDGQGAALYCYGETSVSFSSLYGNDTGSAIAAMGEGTDLVNNIIADTNGAAIFDADEYNDPGIFNNVFWNVDAPLVHSVRNAKTNVSGVDELNLLPFAQNNILADPLFADPLEQDFHLGMGSPCIGAGLEIENVFDDFDRQPRPNVSGYTVGAYQETGVVQIQNWNLY